MDVKIIVILTLGVFSQHLVQGAAPTFGDTADAGTVAEDADIGTTISLTATKTALTNTPTAITILDTSTPDGAESLFSVALNGDSDDFVLTTAAALDRETVESYSLNVQASNTDGQVAIAVTVTVSDVNDNTPMFSITSACIARATETPAGTQIVTFAATDADSATFGLATTPYAFTPSTAPFDIDNSGVITVKTGQTLSTGGNWVLTVTATDKGTPALVGTGTVTICVGADCCASSAGFIRATALVFAVVFITLYI